MSWSSIDRLVESVGCVAMNLAASSNLSGYWIVATSAASHPLSKPSGAPAIWLNVVSVLLPDRLTPTRGIKSPQKSPLKEPCYEQKSPS